MYLGPFNPLGPAIFLKPPQVMGAMPKPKDRGWQLPPGWRLDPDPPANDNGNIAREVNNGNVAHEVNVPYILLPDNAMPLTPLEYVVTAYLAARQINAFLRSL